jgi:hypothetical protein
MHLSGRTEVLPLFDLVQMLSVNEATGMLRVESTEGKGYLYLQRGAVINALDPDHRDGEEAAKRVFALADAEFAFTPELPSVSERIRCSTQSLMMEIARQLDEERIGQGEEPSHGDRVRGAQAASDALREIFRQLDQDSRLLSQRSHQGLSLPALIEKLAAHPGGVLFLREGSPPAVRSGDRLAPATDTALDRRGYEELRDLLLREAVPVAGAAGAPDAYLLAAGSLGRLRIEPVTWDGGELTAVRALPAEAETGPAWPVAALEDALAAPGTVVLLAAPDRTALAAAFAAAAGRMLARGIGPAVAFARRWSAAAPPAGVVMLSTLRPRERAAGIALVDRLDPALVAVEDAACAPARAAALHGLRGGSRALVGVCAAAGPDAGDRLLEGLDGAALRAWTRALGAGLATVIAADGSARPVDARVRTALRAGDTGPLAAALR